MEEMAVTDDGCRLWTTRSGGRDPLILCHGGPGFWDTFGGPCCNARERHPHSPGGRPDDQ